MRNEFEVVAHDEFPCLNIFAVRLLSRTPHLHREMEIGVILEGHVTVKMGESAWRIEAGEAYLINSMQAHEFITDGDGTLTLAIQISPEIVGGVVRHPDRIRLKVPPPLKESYADGGAYHELVRLCRRLAVRYLERDDGYRIHCFQLIGSILLNLQTNLPSEMLSKRDFLPIRRRAERMTAITDYIEQNFCRKLLMEEIAAREGLTMTYLSHLFRETLGVSFQDYLCGIRFEYAFPLVANTERPILDISLECGFSDPRYLIRTFQRELGCTPKEYRRQLRGGAQRASAGSLQHILAREETLRRLRDGE